MTEQQRPSLLFSFTLYDEAHPEGVRLFGTATENVVRQYVEAHVPHMRVADRLVIEAVPTPGKGSSTAGDTA